MAKFRVETPTGIIEVEAADNATDAEIEALAREKYVPGQTSTATTAEPDAVPDTGMNQARVVGAIAGGVNAGIRPTVGAATNMVRGMYNIATAAPISANPVEAVKAGMATPGSTVKIGDTVRALADPEVRAINTIQMSKDPVLAAKEFAPKATALGQQVAKIGGRVMGPYGLITSAQDATQRFRGAEGLADYAQAGISGLGALGYGVGTLPTPAKPFGMGVGMAADAANAGIDYMRQPPSAAPPPPAQMARQFNRMPGAILDEDRRMKDAIRKKAFEKVMGPVAPGSF